MREQVEGLEDHADVGPQVGQRLAFFGQLLPSMVIVPDWIVSSRLIARHSVDLPEPDGPRTTTTSPLRTVRLMLCSTWRSPKYLSTSLSTTRGSPS